MFLLQFLPLLKEGCFLKFGEATWLNSKSFF